MLALAMGVVTLTSAGCAESAIAAAGATAGFGLAQGQAESVLRGKLRAARLVPIERAREGVLAALAELQLPIVARRDGEYDGYFRMQAENREIQIWLKADSPAFTRFTVRVGFFGDSAVAQLLMARIDHALGIENPHGAPGGDGH